MPYHFVLSRYCFRRSLLLRFLSFAVCIAHRSMHSVKSHMHTHTRIHCFLGLAHVSLYVCYVCIYIYIYSQQMYFCHIFVYTCSCAALVYVRIYFSGLLFTRLHIIYAVSCSAPGTTQRPHACRTYTTGAICVPVHVTLQCQCDPCVKHVFFIATFISLWCFAYLRA